MVRHRRVTTNIKNKVNQNGLSITTADKNAGMVVMDTMRYIYRKSGIHYTTFDRDPLQTFVNITRATLKTTRDTVKKFTHNSPNIMNPRSPR